MPNDPVQADRHQRLRLQFKGAFGLLSDLLFHGLIALGIAMLLFGTGLSIALSQADAQIISTTALGDGSDNQQDTSLLLGSEDAATIGELWQWVYQPSNWADLPPYVSPMRQDFESAFAVFFIACTVTVMAVVVYGILALVAATMMKGAPLWQRRFGLIYRQRESMRFPSVLGCCWLWAVMLVLWPWQLLALICCLPRPVEWLCPVVLDRRGQ